MNTLAIVWRRGQVAYVPYADLENWFYSTFGLTLDCVNGERRRIPWSAIEEVIEGCEEEESVSPSGPGPSTGSDVPQGHEDQPQREELEAPEQTPVEHVGGKDDGRDNEQDGAHVSLIPEMSVVETLAGTAQKMRRAVAETKREQDAVLAMLSAADHVRMNPGGVRCGCLSLLMGALKSYGQ